jgi:uridine kinase
LGVDDLARHLSDSDATTALIDGRSGSGKSTLAQQLHLAWQSSLVVRLDDIYPGWDGLAAASEHLHDMVLMPLSSGGDARWQRWDWTVDAPAEWHDVDPGLPLIVEGCGSLSRANRSLASMGIWVELDAETRKRRALERDGDAYRPHWDRWATQEQCFAEREHPAELADLVVDGRQLSGR